jgi:diguanylate cyclase (GGDEF)-like protein
MDTNSSAQSTQVAYLYGRTSQVTVVAATFFALWMCWALRGSAVAGVLLEAAAAFVALQLARLWHMQYLTSRQFSALSGAYLVGNVLTGLAWGLGTAFVYTRGDAGLAALAAIGVGGMCGTAVAMYGGQGRALWAFTTPMMVPTISAQFIAIHPHGALFGLTMLIGWLSTLGTGRQVWQSIRNVVEGRRRFAELAAAMEAKNHEVQNLNRQLQLAAREQAVLLERAEVGIAMLVGENLVRVNSFMCQTLALPKDQLEGRSIRHLTDASDRRVVDRLLLAQSSGTEDKADLCFRRASGQLWFEVAVAGVGEDDVGVWVFNDVTERLAQHQRSRQEAEEDALTGLLNRRGYEQATTASTRATAGMALVAIDLDGFKPVNDEHGHAAGDRVLAEMGRRIAQTVRAGDIAARCGGDEFLIMLPGVASTQVVSAFCARLRSALLAPIALDGKHVIVGASIGAAIASSAAPLSELEKAADAAMYRAKRHNSSTPEVVEFSSSPAERSMAAASGLASMA